MTKRGEDQQYYTDFQYSYLHLLNSEGKVFL